MNWPGRTLAGFAVLFGVCAGGGQSLAQDAIGLRYGDHPGFGRVVLDLGDRPQPAVTRNGDTVTVAAKVVLPRDPAPPRNVRAVSLEGEGLVLQVAPGAVMRPMGMDHRLVLDFLDAGPKPVIGAGPAASPKPVAAPPQTRASSLPPVLPTARPVAPQTVPAPATTASQVPALAKASSPPSLPPASVPAEAKPLSLSPIPAQLPAPSPAPTAVPVTAVDALPLGAVTEAGPPQTLTSAASSQPVPNNQPGHALALPFDAKVGAAAFRRGEDALLVFDVRRPVDLQDLQNDPVFADAKVRLLSTATVIQWHLPDRTELRLSRTEAGWTATAIGGDATVQPLAPIVSKPSESGLLLAAAAPGLVVSVPDPLTGAALLVGTQRQPGQGNIAGRHTPDFVLVPSFQGVVVEALSDAVSLTATADGFVIGAAGEGRTLASTAADEAAQAASDASVMTRLFDFPRQSTDWLHRRLQSRQAEASMAPAQSRVEPRRRVAEAMVALGLGVEAASVLDLAIKDDARAAEDPRVIALSGIAAVLSGRNAGSAGLDDPRLDGTDEITLWRAVRRTQSASTSTTANSAQAFETTLPLLLSYPQTLRERILPLAAETMAQVAPNARLNKLLASFPTDPALAMARAMARRAEGGDPAEALAMFDHLATSADRLIRLRAAEAAAELRLARGLASPAQTADTLGKLLFAWRDDDTEIDRRLRVADLLAQSGQVRPAIKLLRDTLQIWPQRDESIRSRLQASFNAALTPQAQMSLSAFDLVALAEENADLMPAGEPGRLLAEQVSDRLVELDLPERAVKLLDQLARATPPGIARATFGQRLADARLQLNDPVGAVAALAATTADTLSGPLLERRTLAFATAVAAQHDLASAARALRDLDTEAGDTLLAQLREQAGDWPGAVDAWRRLVDRTVPGNGVLAPDQAATLLRLASAAARASDTATLALLRQRDAARIPPGQLSDTFNLLVAPAIQGVNDLRQSAHDTSLIKAVPAALSVMAANPPRNMAATR